MSENDKDEFKNAIREIGYYSMNLDNPYGNILFFYLLLRGNIQTFFCGSYSGKFMSYKYYRENENSMAL